MSSAFSSKCTAASLLSERGFIPRTMNPRLASSVVAMCDMKLAVRWINRIATCGAGPVRSVERAFDRPRGELDVERRALRERAGGERGRHQERQRAASHHAAVPADTNLPSRMP